MALPQIFVSTPVEAGLWTAAVTTQAQIAKAFTSSPVFWGVVSIAIGFMVIRVLMDIGGGQGRDFALKRFAFGVLCVTLGITFLKKENTSPFSPVNASNREWRNVPKVAANPKYKPLQSQEKGLYWYTFIHRSMWEVAGLMTDIVSKTAGDSSSKEAPEYLLNAFAQTARATIDDPDVERTFDSLVFNCSDTKTGKVLGNTDSLKSMFTLENPECNQLYNSLKTKLESWARSKLPTYVPPTGSNSIVGAAYYMANPEFLTNKIIASAVKNYAKTRVGESTLLNSTNNDALIDGSDFWVNVSKTFSTDSILMIANAFTGEYKDLEGASARNELAVTYNRILQFLPAMRGYANVILAYAFIAAAMGLCVGVPKLFYGWLKMTAMFCLYMPFSAALYQFTTRLISTSQNLATINAIQADPFVLAGASVLDSNIARITAVYFSLQIALLLIFAVGGLSSFHPLQTLSHSFVGGMVRNTIYTMSFASRAISGGLSSVAGSITNRALKRSLKSKPD